MECEKGKAHTDILSWGGGEKNTSVGSSITDLYSFTVSDRVFDPNSSSGLVWS